MAKRREHKEGSRPRTIIQRVVVPVERIYERTKHKTDHMSGTSALKYLAVSAASGLATHYAQKGIKKLVGSHDPLWVSAPMTAASIVAATQLRGYWQAGAFGAAVDSAGQMIGDAYHHVRQPAHAAVSPQSAATQPSKRNANAEQLAAAYEAARRELATQQLNALPQYPSTMHGVYGMVPSASY